MDNHFIESAKNLKAAVPPEFLEAYEDNKANLITLKSIMDKAAENTPIEVAGTLMQVFKELTTNYKDYIALLGMSQYHFIQQLAEDEDVNPATLGWMTALLNILTDEAKKSLPDTEG